MLGGEQSGHLIYLRDHVTGDGLAAALLVCAALEGRTLAEAVAVMPRYPQVKENVRVARRELTPALREAIEERNAELDGEGRILVRASGTEPVIRVLAEAPDEGAARPSVLPSPLSFNESSVRASPQYGDPEDRAFVLSERVSVAGQRDQEERDVRDHRIRRKP